MNGLAAALERLRSLATPGPEPAGPSGDHLALPLHHMFFLWEQVPEEAAVANLCPVQWWIEGDLDRPALLLSLNDVHARHQALSAGYRMEPGPTAVLGTGPARAEVHLLDDQPDDQSTTRAVHDLLFRPLAISRGQIWRSVLARSGAGGRHLLAVVVHHIAFDGAAEAVLAADLRHVYRARHGGQAPIFDQAATTLPQLLAENERRLAAIDRNAHLAYWDRQLADLPAARLPERQDSSAAAGRRSSAKVDVPAAHLTAWDDTVRRRGASRLVYLSAVCGAALRDLTGQDDVALMLALSRRLGDPERTMSTRVDMLGLRLRPQIGESALENAATVVGEPMAAQDLAFFESARTLYATGRSDVVLRTPVLIVQDERPEPLFLPGCHVRSERLEPPTTVTELDIQFWSAGDNGLTVWVNTRDDRVPARIGQILATAIGRLLVAGPAALPSRTIRAGDLTVTTPHLTSEV